jgi:hypothetical protein
LRATGRYEGRWSAHWSGKAGADKRVPCHCGEHQFVPETWHMITRRVLVER